jgi:hypothetical protein
VKLVVATKQGEVRLSVIPDDVDRAIPQGEKAGRYDVGVIIGNRNYGPSGAVDVEYANRDARIMKAYLVKTLGYDPANIIYVEDATFAKFNEIFGSDKDYKGRLYNYVKPGLSRVFIYYSGHGVPDLESHEAYFFPVDASPAYIKANGYPLQTFYENLSRLPAKKITLVVDACFSGNLQRGSLFRNMSPAMVKVKKEYQGPPHATILVSGAMDQVATWFPEKGHSLFTYYFLKGLQGQADINRDRRITVGEMKAYLMEHVPYMSRRLNGIEQHPVITGDGSEIMAILKK